MNYKLLNPDAFREFAFRQWKTALFARSGMWYDDYKKMNLAQKLIFHCFGKIPESFQPKFEVWLSGYPKFKTGVYDESGREICEGDIGELKVIDREKLEEAINEKNKNTP